jgi:hypothetical protein
LIIIVVGCFFMQQKKKMSVGPTPESGLPVSLSS